MNRLTMSLAMCVFSLVGCAGSGTYDLAAVSKPEAGEGYCQRRMQPIGPTDPARITPSGSGDYIDYSGPCSGPSIQEQINKQKRFERFRFGRDYMDR